MGICKQHEAKLPNQLLQEKEDLKREIPKPTPAENARYQSVLKFTQAGDMIHKMFLDEKKDFIRYYLLRNGITLEAINELINSNLADAIRTAKCMSVGDNIEERPWR